MLAYISRRLSMMLVIVFGASFLAYNLQAYSSDPLSAFGESTAINKDYLIAKTIRDLQLDVPPPIRYFSWLRGIVAGLWGDFDMGLSRSNIPVSEILAMAIPVTIKLVITATFLAIVFGISVGMITAIRQYSRFDYTMTFFSFLLFSLPIFWVAVLLKEFMAIQFNDFLADPRIPPVVVMLASLVFGFVLAGFAGGTRVQFFSVLAGAALFAGLVLTYVSATQWFLEPSLGIFGVSFLALCNAVIVIQLITGLDSKKGRNAGIGTAIAIAVLYYPLQLVMSADASVLNVIAVFSITITVGILIGIAVSKIDRRVYMRIGLFTALISTFPIIIDRFMAEFSDYLNSDAVNGRPVPTLGQANDLLTPEQLDNFWISGLDTALHLVLPTIALTLISFAGYVRFSRGSLLEVLNMDYIRTARAKGLNERTVIVRHGMRNAMLPLTTILVNDFAGLIGGAIITEGVFAWKGMGQVFNDAIRNYDLNLFMGVFIISASLTVLANFVADLLYGVVDPRIRIRK
ncbi:MAG: ABC transporter permease [Candidatus Nanopelagicaceae bacterium]|nr:ABC transporter permease [Candidatus Nanopelagicaceae bacterium]